MALNRKQLQEVMRANENEMIDLYDQNKVLREKIKQLETDIRHFDQQIKVLESIKIEQKASTGVWKAIAAAMAAIGAMVGALFFKRED